MVSGRHQQPRQAEGDDAQRLRDHTDPVQFRKIGMLLFAVAAKCEGNGNAPQGRKVRNTHTGIDTRKKKSARYSLAHAWPQDCAASNISCN